MGLARSTLSKIENGQMSPTYDALKKLAAGLEISVPQLFTPSAKTQINVRMVVTKSNQATAHALPTYEHELLSETLTKKSYFIEPTLGRVSLKNLMDRCVTMVKSFSIF